LIPIFIFIRKFRELLKESLYRAAAVALGVIIYGTISEYYLERNLPGSGIKTLFDSLWWVMQTVTTVGYGDTPVVGFYGRLNAIFIMIFGIGSLGYFTASLAANLMDAKLAKKLGEVKLKMKDHVIVINSDENLSYIIKELNASNYEVALIGDSDPNLKDCSYEFVKGDPTNTETLERAGLKNASKIIILPHSKEGNPMDIDARTILTALIIKREKKDAYIIASLLMESNSVHAKKVGIDEVVIKGSMSTLILVNAAISPGVSRLFYELLRDDDGYRIRERKIPEELTGAKIREIYKYYENDGSIILAMRKDNDVKLRPDPNQINNFNYVIIMEKRTK